MQPRNAPSRNRDESNQSGRVPRFRGCAMRYGPVGAEKQEQQGYPIDEAGGSVTAMKWVAGNEMP